MQKQFIFFFLLLVISCFVSISSRKWSPNDLALQVTSWNYLNDPEELIADKTLGSKIYTNYLKVNQVYEKTDVNLFLISDVIEKYVYKKYQFVEDLYYEMENNTAINTNDKKEHHLIIVIILKTKDLYFYPSSDKLAKLLKKEEIQQIQLQIKQNLEKNPHNYAQAVYFTFEKLQILWKRFTKKQYGGAGNKPRYNSNKKDYSWIKDVLYVCASVFMLGLIGCMCCCNKCRRGDYRT